MCMDMWERVRESKGNRWDERIRDGENRMGRYGKVEGERWESVGRYGRWRGGESRGCI